MISNISESLILHPGDDVQHLREDGSLSGR
jgi:hypothetical protein